MSRRGLLWTAFAAVHLIVAALGWLLPNQPMGDVYLVYEPWAASTLSGSGIPGIHSSFVYPQLALVPMLLAEALSWAGGYIIAWAVLVTALDAVAFAVLVGRARSRGRVRAAWFWLGFALLLGPIGMYRIDAITVPIAVVALLLLARRPVLAAALLTAGAWIKVWPAALVAAAAVAVRRRVSVIVSAAAVSLAVLGAIVAAGGAAHALGFVTGQTGRGLQLEAPVSAFYLWRAVLGEDGSFIYYDGDMLTFQVAGPEVDVVIALMTPLLACAGGAVLVLGAIKAWRGASFARLMPPLALALVLVLIVVNKVGSPQFQTWLIAPLVLWIVLDRTAARLPAALALIVAALTMAVYPLTYGGLLAADSFAATVLTARNALVIGLLVLVLVHLARVPVRRARIRRPAAPGAEADARYAPSS
ncbi:hypothetical protein AB2L57_13080 [Microbacterium sp. HA-8]|uniref:hypothetical protein n=1 Tax=Microbacterium sp. HA-8 TaxID=3234200 RepID=UPI0038F6FD3D